jgi:threonine efflux protein
MFESTFDLTALAALTVTFGALAGSPGPATLSLATTAMAQGRTTALRYAFGLSVGLSFWGLIAATGLGAVLVAISEFLVFMKIMGGCYLLWLAYQSYTAGRQIDESAPIHKMGFTQGLLLNLSNPKAVVTWMFVLVIGVSGDDDWIFVAVATFSCIVVSFVINFGSALLW